MAFEFSTEELPDDPTQTYSVKPGTYHVRVSKVDEDGGKNGEMIVDYEVLAGTVPGQEAEKHRDYFSKTSKAQGRMVTFAIACGLLTLDEYKDAKENGRNLSIEFTDAVDRQLVVDLHEEEYQGRKKTKAGFGLYRVDDKVVADKGVPLHQGMIKEFAKKVALNMPDPSAKTSAPADPFGGAI